MIRRFVNVVAENEKTGVYTLHRLDVLKHLFHRSRADARVVPPLLAEAQDTSGDEQPTKLDWLKELPTPCVKIHPSLREELWEVVDNKIPFWALLSPAAAKTNCSASTRWATPCSATPASRPSTLCPIPHLRADVGLRPISFSVLCPDAQDQDQDQDQEDLYVIPFPRLLGPNASCFRVFRRDADAADGWPRWRWESLPPPPPFLFEYSTSYTVVDGGRTICFSYAPPAPGIDTYRFDMVERTYCFDTAEREWRHAGDWLLPLLGRAEYVPDLALWLGFSPCSPRSYLCGTTDLDAAMAMAMDHPPKLQYVWQDLVTPENWSAGPTRVVNLGSGRFCIAKNFVMENCHTGKSFSGFEEEWWELEAEVLVLTGIEVGRGDDGRIEVWKHKSIEYNSGFSVNGVL